MTSLQPIACGHNPDSKKQLPTPLPELAKIANQAHHGRETAAYECETAANRTVQYALTAGRALEDAKAQLPHGEWGEWLRKNCSFSERTARSYMQVVRDWPEFESKRQGTANLSLSEVLRLIASPKQQADDTAAETLDVLPRYEVPLPSEGEQVVGFDGRFLLTILRAADRSGFYFVEAWDSEQPGPVRSELRFTQKPVRGDYVGTFADRLLQPEGTVANVHWRSEPGESVSGYNHPQYREPASV